VVTPPFCQQRSFSKCFPIWAGMTLVFLLGACSRPIEKSEDIRPVRVMRLVSDKADRVTELTGDVRPRVESRLGFRVGGKIIERKVDVGTIVKRGQVLMQLDPQDLQLAQMQSSAALQAAQSNRDMAQAELKRYRNLREQNFVSQAVLDAKQTAFKSAQAGYDQTLAAYQSQSNQARYAKLFADIDGVVIGIDAEVGQVVAAGAPVVRVAQTRDKEIAINIPEGKVDALRQIGQAQIHLWAYPEVVIHGKIREIAPMADAATRTYAAKIALSDAPEAIKLGMTAYVTFSAPTDHAMIKVPLTALVREKSGTAVWVVEDGRVKSTPVQVSAPIDDEHMLVTKGVMPGQTIVTAGANLLRPGQKVSILDVSAGDAQ